VLQREDGLRSREEEESFEGLVAGEMKLKPRGGFSESEKDTEGDWILIGPMMVKTSQN